MQKYSTSSTDNNEMAKITVTSYLAGTVNHPTKNKMVKLLFSLVGTWMY